MARRPLLACEARVLLHVRDLERLAVQRHPAGRALAEGQLPVLQAQAEPIGDRAHREAPRRLVGDPEGRERHRDQLGGRLRDRLEHLVHVERGRHDVGQAREAAQARRAHVEGLVEACVLERGRHLVGEDRQVLDLALGEALARLPVGHQRAFEVLADERHRQDRPPADLLDPEARLRAQVDPRVREHVGGPHRAPLQEGASHHSLVHPERAGPIRQRPRELPLPHHESHEIVLAVPEPDGEIRHLQRLPGVGGHQLQHPFLVQGRDELAAQLGHRPHALGLLGGVAIQARVVDRDGGLAREGLGQLLLARGEGPAPAEDEHPDGPLAHQKGNPQVVRVAEAVPGRLVVRQYVGALELAHERLARREHLAAQALPRPDPRPPHGLGRGAVQARHHQIVAVEQPEARVVHFQQPGRLLGDRGEQGFGGGERPDLLVDLEQRGQRGLAIALLGEQPRVVEGNRGLAGQRGHDRDLARRRGMGLPPVGREGAEHLTLAHKRHRQHRAIALPFDQRTRARAQRDRRVVQHVLGPGRLAQLRRPAGRPLAQPHLQRGQELGGEAATPLVDEEAGGPVQAGDA